MHVDKKHLFNIVKQTYSIASVSQIKHSKEKLLNTLGEIMV